MSDVVAGREGRFPSGSDLASAWASSLRTPGHGVVRRRGCCRACRRRRGGRHLRPYSSSGHRTVGGRLSAIARRRQAVCQCAGAGGLRRRRGPGPRNARCSRPRPALRVGPADAWAPAGGLSTLLATRFPSASQTPSGEAEVAAVPLPPPRARRCRASRQSSPAASRCRSRRSSRRCRRSPSPANSASSTNCSPIRIAPPKRCSPPIRRRCSMTSTKRAVYLPDGEKLEAHSGFGKWMDDPESVDRKNRRRDAAQCLCRLLPREAVSWRARAAHEAGRRRQHVWPRRHPGAFLFARRGRRVERLRVGARTTRSSCRPMRTASSTGSSWCAAPMSRGRRRSRARAGGA